MLLTIPVLICNKDLCHLKIHKGCLTHLTEHSTSGISQTRMKTMTWKLGGEDSNGWERLRRDDEAVVAVTLEQRVAVSYCIDWWP